MYFSHIPSAAAALLVLATPAVSMLDCTKIVASERKFDLSPLSGPHSVTISQQLGRNFHNTTFTTDICRGLKRKTDVDKSEQCPHGTRVCATEHIIGQHGDTKFDEFNEAWAIAGELSQYGGGHLDYETVYLPTSDSNADAEKDGVRVILKGGWHIGSNGQKRLQRSIIEFVCDKELEGTEGEWKSEDEYIPGDDEPSEKRGMTDPALDAAAEDDDKGEGDNGDKIDKPVQLGSNKTQALTFNSYGPLDNDANIDILRLTWKTKYACQKRDGDSEPSQPGQDKPSSHWGFFTWIVIL